MTRSILAALAASATIALVVATGGCNSTGVGDPCTPEAEYSQSFLGFDKAEVNIESKSFQCQTRLCLANHFQGRVTCPYGQTTTGAPTPPATACGTETNQYSGGMAAPYGCCTPIGQVVDGIDTTLSPPGYDSTTNGAQILPQCTDRTADKAVYCSCRCANVDGQTNDGANYCTCPSGFSCTQLVSSIGATDQGLTGAYCIKSGTEYDPGSSCQTPCDPSAGNCGAAPGVTVQ
ncbi:MAG: hypothetical protein ABSE49_23555 [Polyangiaceae bacterium]|jgi:hypothetical protein